MYSSEEEYMFWLAELLCVKEEQEVFDLGIRLMSKWRKIEISPEMPER
jgi:hypothetical protein